MRCVVGVAAMVVAVLGAACTSVGLFAEQSPSAHAGDRRPSTPEAGSSKSKPDARHPAFPGWFWTSPRPPARTKRKRANEPPPWFWRSKRAEADEQSRKRTRLMLFSGVDAWRQGAFLYGGTLWAPFGAAADGPVVKVLTTRGIYTYRSGALGNADVLGQMTAISVMPGLHFTRGGISATVYAGLDRQWHVLIPDDVANPARGYHSGVRVAADLWIEPTTQTMITASATLTTIASAYALRLAGGWRAFDSVYIGPEGEIFGAENYRQWRFGMHVTGVKFFRLELQAAAGYSADRDGNAGAYVRFQATRKN